MNKDFESYKIELLNKLNCFKEAYENLKSFFENDDFDCNNYICDDYPFDKSFDELDISDWIYSVEKNLEKGVE